MRISCFAVAGAILAFCGSAHATQYVVNGSFGTLSPQIALPAINLTGLRGPRLLDHPWGGARSPP